MRKENAKKEDENKLEKKVDTSFIEEIRNIIGIDAKKY